VLELSPLHNTASIFQWTREQEYAAQAAAAGVQPVEQQQHVASHSEHAAASAGETASNTSSGTTGNENAEAEHNSSEEMSEAAESSQPFESTWGAGGWLVDNPLGVPTERENYVLSQGGKVFRVLLVRQ
jgi:tRNA (guanine-N7-)-methyltransferase